MTSEILHVKSSVTIERAQLGKLIAVLAGEGYEVVGPTVREGAIVYDRVASLDDLPAGWGDVQDGGKYRLQQRGDQALFGYAVGPHSWKEYLYPPRQRLWQATRNNGFHAVLEELRPVKRALLGVRACELHALAIQDKVFLAGPFVDPLYQAHRENLFLVAVNCSAASGTCFCASMNTGPKADSSYDLALTEIVQSERHYFVIEVGTERGAEVLAAIPYQDAGEAEKQAAADVVATTSQHMGRELNVVGIKELLYRNYQHPRWDQVAARCLTCANCTMVCPTCFCTTIEDVTDLTGKQAERWRSWDSCFTMDFSYIHGGSVRATPKARYRQWLTHKLATWHDQFGTSGCVGCGRCITWCPVGIDLTEEVRAIRESESGGEKNRKGTT